MFGERDDLTVGSARRSRLPLSEQLATSNDLAHDISCTDAFGADIRRVVPTATVPAKVCRGTCTFDTTTCLLGRAPKRARLQVLDPVIGQASPARPETPRNAPHLKTAALQTS